MKPKKPNPKFQTGQDEAKAIIASINAAKAKKKTPVKKSK